MSKEFLLKGFIPDVSRGFSLIFITILLLIGLTTQISSAALHEDSNLTISSVTDDSISWYYTYNAPIQVAAFDGIKLENFDNQSSYYTASNLGQGSYHTFCIYVDAQNCETVNTTSTQSEQEKTFSVINLYVFFFIALGCLLVSAWIKLAAYLSLVFSLMGILQCVNNNFYMGIVFVTMTLISIASLGYDRA